jgi:hypothetical protein
MKMKITITKALIIDEPWISKILRGEKDWEMRSIQTKHRGLFGLIRKGSGQVVGIANLINVSGKYSNDGLALNIAHHHVGPEIYENPDYKWRYAWEMADVKLLDEPVAYIHKNGAVTWVTLDTAAVENIARQVDGELLSSNTDEALKQSSEAFKAIQIPVTSTAKEIQAIKRIEIGLTLVPVAKDGSVFSPETANNKGVYTVGNKGDQKKFGNFNEALDYLKSMSTARWRRKNSNGTPGIVTAVNWIES